MSDRALAPIPEADHLRMFVADRDVACPSCAYNLRGLTADVCPECSQALRLQVGLVEPRLGLWIAALVGATAGAGFNGLLLIYVVLRMLGRGLPGPRGFMEPFILCNAVGFTVMAALVIGLIRGRRRFRRARPALQWMLTAAAWAAAMIDVAVFSYHIT